MRPTMGEVKEYWWPIEGFENSYWVSNTGKIKSRERYFFSTHRSGKQFINTVPERIIRTTYDRKGYEKCTLKYKNEQKFMFVHRAIAKAFIPNPDNKPHINHKNGNPSDNRIENLEWCTQAENVHHAIHVLGRRFGKKPKPLNV